MKRQRSWISCGNWAFYKASLLCKWVITRNYGACLSHEDFLLDQPGCVGERGNLNLKEFKGKGQDKTTTSSCQILPIFEKIFNFELSSLKAFLLFCLWMIFHHIEFLIKSSGNSSLIANDSQNTRMNK